MILITDETKNDFFHSVELFCEKKSAYISLDNRGVVNVLCKNAANRAWRGMGRFFDSWEQALAAYKSAAMKAMIELAQRKLSE